MEEAVKKMKVDTTTPYYLADYSYPDMDEDVVYFSSGVGIGKILQVVIGMAAILVNVAGLWKLHRNSKGEGQFHIILKLMGWLGLTSILIKMVFTVFSGIVQHQYLFRVWSDQLFPFLFPAIIPLWEITETMFYFMAALLCYERKRSCTFGQAGNPIKWTLIIMSIVAISLIQAVPACFLYRPFLSEESTSSRTIYKIRFTELATSSTYHFISSVLRLIVLLVPFIITIHQLYTLARTKPSVMTQEDLAASEPMNTGNKTLTDRYVEEPAMDSSSLISQNIQRAISLQTAVLFIVALSFQILQHLFTLLLSYPFFIYNIFSLVNTVHLGSSLIFYIIMDRN